MLEFTVAFTVVASSLFALVASLQRQVRDTRMMVDRSVAADFLRSQLEFVRALPRERLLALDGGVAPLPLAAAGRLPEFASEIRVRVRADEPTALDVTAYVRWLDIDGGTARFELTGVWTPGEER